MAFATPVIYGRIHIKMWKTVLFEVSGAQEHKIVITNILLRLLIVSILLNTVLIILSDTLDALIG